jgi:hypothetical protein
VHQEDDDVIIVAWGRYKTELEDAIAKTRPTYEWVTLRNDVSSQWLDVMHVLQALNDIMATTEMTPEEARCN